MIYGALHGLSAAAGLPPTGARGHFAILKVGAGADLRAARSAVRPRSSSVNGWGERQSAQLCATLEQVMREQPQQRSPLLPRHAAPNWIATYSLSDRVRYYWPQPQVQQAVDGLLDNLRRRPAPLALLSQYLRIRRGR
ncbi:class II D-tagatose-bisphosphate aldolase, non-catalytic subunit [Serratia ureilytica]